MDDAALINCFRQGFPPGPTPITREGEDVLDMGVDFSVLVLEPGGAWTAHGEQTSKETCWVLLDGQIIVTIDGHQHEARRASLFGEAPTALHVAAGASVRLAAAGGRAELAVARASNGQRFAPRLFRPDEITREDRGAGLAQGACRREVRLVFDRASRPQSNLVVGEVATLAGRWSSYPPHHHAQPEIYHYRFTLPQGFGHAELGESVFKVRHYDTLKIPPGRTHAQAAAPGYGMWYLWVVRHLEGRPYTGFTYEPEHRWLLDPAQQGWLPDVSPPPAAPASGEPTTALTPTVGPPDGRSPAGGTS
jgi:5-deoxy-glucuronate isomerase